MVRSTTQRLGPTTKPLTRSDRSTISVSRSGQDAGQGAVKDRCPCIAGRRGAGVPSAGGCHGLPSRRQRPAPGHQQPRPTPARALRASERAHVLDVLASPRFVEVTGRGRRRCSMKAGICAPSARCTNKAANQPVRERQQSSTPSPSWWPRGRRSWDHPAPGAQTLDVVGIFSGGLDDAALVQTLSPCVPSFGPRRADEHRRLGVTRPWSATTILRGCREDPEALFPAPCR